MTKANDLTDRALQGYNSPDTANPYLWSSASYIAFCVGQWLNATGRSAPRDARMSRGYSFRCSDMLIAWKQDGTCERIN